MKDTDGQQSCAETKLILNVLKKPLRYEQRRTRGKDDVIEGCVNLRYWYESTQQHPVRFSFPCH